LATDDIAELGGTTGAVIDVRPLDVTSASQIAELVDNLNADGLRVQCVVHLAGKVLDAPLAATNFDAFLHVMRPKVLGATILHEATKHDQPLFILFSSLASIVGSPGQASYSAANSFLDSFSTWRAQEGFPTVCVSWGPWEAPGMARRFGLDKFRRRGLTPLSSAQAIEALAAIDPEQDRHLIVADFHWPTFIRGHDQRLVRSIVPDAFQAVKPTMPRGGFRNALLGRQLGDRQHLLSRKISEAVAATLGVAPSEVSDTVAFLDLGLDSLMTVELKEELEHALDASISIAAFVDHGTPAQLARHVLGDLLPVEEEPKSSRAQEWNDDLMTDLRFRLEKA
jgi:acyl carrier protein